MCLSVSFRCQSDFPLYFVPMPSAPTAPTAVTRRVGTITGHMHMRMPRALSSHATAAADRASIARNIVVSPSVAAALRRGEPVVALESTIISHGVRHTRTHGE